MPSLKSLRMMPRMILVYGKKIDRTRALTFSSHTKKKGKKRVDVVLSYNSKPVGLPHVVSRKSCGTVAMQSVARNTLLDGNVPHERSQVYVFYIQASVPVAYRGGEISSPAAAISRATR